MNTATLRLALIASLLFNLGVLAALGWQQLAERASASGTPLLVRELQLDDRQQRQWQDIEAPFMLELNASTLAIQQQRNQLIDHIFAEQLDAELIRAAQSTLAELQNRQQQLVIEQLLREREILDASQRQHLAHLLMRQSPQRSDVETLHNE